MRVGFGTSVLAKGLLTQSGIDGIGIYTRELGRALLSVEGLQLISTGFRFCADAEMLPGIQSQINLGRFDVATLTGALTPFACPTEYRLVNRVDLFHAPDHMIPKLKRIPVVATLHDAIPLARPELLKTQRVDALKNWLWKRTARWADRIITISEYAKQDIVRHFRIPAEKISVVPQGVHPRFFEKFDDDTKAATLARLGLPKHFFLFVGTLQPRKNLERLLDAHALLPTELRKEFPLVIVGRTGWRYETLVARLAALKETGAAMWMQYLPDVDVRILLQSASALVFPSLAEGFGLPVLEAFASGLPVITSNTTSLPEVAGDAAILIDPTDTGAIADAMLQLIKNAGLCERLRAAGFARAQQYTWQTCALRTHAVYQSVLG